MTQPPPPQPQDGSTALHLAASAAAAITAAAPEPPPSAAPTASQTPATAPTRYYSAGGGPAAATAPFSSPSAALLGAGAGTWLGSQPSPAKTHHQRPGVDAATTEAAAAQEAAAQEALVAALLAAGADKEAKREVGVSAVTGARLLASGLMPQPRALMLCRACRADSAYAAAMQPHPGAIGQLCPPMLKPGVSPNPPLSRPPPIPQNLACPRCVPLQDGRTPLAVAAAAGNAAAVRALLAAGADVGVRDKVWRRVGSTALAVKVSGLLVFFSPPYLPCYGAPSLQPTVCSPPHTHTHTQSGASPLRLAVSGGAGCLAALEALLGGAVEATGRELWASCVRGEVRVREGTWGCRVGHPAHPNRHPLSPSFGPLHPLSRT